MTTVSCSLPQGLVISGAGEATPLTLSGAPSMTNGQQPNFPESGGVNILSAAQSTVFYQWLRSHSDSPLLASIVIVVP